jgi:hypothetical protein
MSESIIKLASALPKGDGVNGFDGIALADELWHSKIEGRFTRPRIAVIVYGVQEAKVDKKGDQVVTAEILRVQPVETEDGLRAVETVLRDEYVAEHGDMIPFDVKQATAPAFADLPRETDEIDQAEERERETMSPADELRRHLERVHGRADAHLLTDGEAEHRHGADHDGDLPGELQHERDWIGWTRADIEAATAESDGDPHADEAHEGQLPLGEGMEPDADGDYDGGRAGSPRESSDPDQVDDDRSVPAATFSGSDH